MKREKTAMPNGKQWKVREKIKRRDALWKGNIPRSGETNGQSWRVFFPLAGKNHRERSVCMCERKKEREREEGRGKYGVSFRDV